MPSSARGFLRHVEACNNGHVPGERTPLRVDGVTAGYARLDVVSRIGGADVPAASLPGIGRALAEAGLCAWRDEAFDVRAELDGPVLGTIDRGALPLLGIRADGVHLNGLVERPGGLHLWVARRAANKRLDPGKLDHIVAGGVPAGLTPADTLEKEAAEEAGMPAALASRAVHQGTISYVMDRPEGLRRDRLHCYDLWLPASFTPRPVDGEVAGFELWPMARVLDTVRDGDAFKFNVNLVAIDLLLRLGLVDDPALARALRHPDPAPA